jgi:ABC-type lipoprotein export system ATPase subunit
VFSDAERRRNHLRRTHFGFVFQFYHLLPELNVLENVLLPRMVATPTLKWGGQKAAARADAMSVLQRVGLGERLKHRPAQLSGGERQRVAIARALVHKPAVLLADEPTGNLDAEAGGRILGLLSELHREGQTIVMVTHDPGIAKAADRILQLENGRLRTT